jgi:uncharacterized damage-inducible protein DinB
MSASAENLTRYYRGWDRYQDLLAESVGSLTDEQLALQAAPSLWPVWMLAAHIISARIGWFHQLMGEAPNQAHFSDMYDWDLDDQPQRTGTELADGLRETWAMIDDSLRRWTSEDLDEVFTTRRDVQRTRQWVIWHVLEHDLHHGGELFFTLGMNGLPTPDL